MPRQDSSDSRPPRPEGDGYAARFFQWVYDQIAVRMTLIDTTEIRWERTTRGIRPILIASRGSSTAGIRGPYLVKSVLLLAQEGFFV